MVFVASLMIGVEAVNESAKAIVISGLVGLVAGTSSMAIGEFVSIYTQYDIMMAQKDYRPAEVVDEEEEDLPIPFQAASASACAFTLDAMLPLLAGPFIKAWAVRVGAVCVVTTAGLAGFGAVSGLLGGTSAGKSTVRVMMGGWLAMLITYDVLRLFGFAFQLQVSSA